MTDERKEKFYVVATTDRDTPFLETAILEECNTRYEADKTLEWHKAHRWLYADNVNLTVKSSKDFFR